MGNILKFSKFKKQRTAAIAEASKKNAYKKHIQLFNEKLKEFKVSSPSELSEEDQIKFYDSLKPMMEAKTNEYGDGESEEEEAANEYGDGESEEEEEFKPHTMYCPKSGKEYKAKTQADHVKFSKLGYVHEKPKMNEAKIKEGNAFSAARQKAIDAGEDEFEFEGETFKVTGDKDTPSMDSTTK